MENSIEHIDWTKNILEATDSSFLPNILKRDKIEVEWIINRITVLFIIHYAALKKKTIKSHKYS